MKTAFNNGLVVRKFDSPEEMDKWVRENCHQETVKAYNKAPGYINPDTGEREFFDKRRPKSNERAS